MTNRKLTEVEKCQTCGGLIEIVDEPDGWGHLDSLTEAAGALDADHIPAPVVPSPSQDAEEVERNSSLYRERA